MADQKKIQSILQFWFEDSDRISKTTESLMKKWYGGKEDVDNYIKQNYLSDLLEISKGTLENWKQQRNGMLAYIILADQFTRNCFRGEGKAFSNDPYAIKATYQVLGNKQLYNQYLPMEKDFILMPLMHSQNLQDQKFLDHQLDLLIEAGKPAGQKGYAAKHRQIIQKFGRFPYRNEVLGRESTNQQIEWLKTGTSFGFKK